MLTGSDMRGNDYESFEINFTEGRDVRPGETGVAAVGSDLVKKLGARVGGYVTVRDEQFLVVGIADKTLTAPDNSVWMSLADAQRLFVKDLPEIVQATR